MALICISLKMDFLKLSTLTHVICYENIFGGPSLSTDVLPIISSSNIYYIYSWSFTLEKNTWEVHRGLLETDIGSRGQQTLCL